MATNEDAISCAVCCEIYSDPRSLPCGHSFCLKCITGIVDNKQKFPCPVCRSIVSLKDGNVDKLPKNYGLRIVIEAKDKTQSLMCLEHSKLLDIYCKTCDMVICSKCLSIQHKGHVIEDIDKIFLERKDKLSTLLAVTKFWAVLMQEKKDIIQQSRNSMQKNSDSINKSVDVIFKIWHATLDLQQKNILRYLDQETEKKMKVYDEAERVLMSSMAKVTELEAEIIKIRSRDTASVVQQYGPIKARHAQVGDNISQDIETSFKPPDDLKIEVYAPWIEEAIDNIKVFDMMPTKESFIMQKISEIQEENTDLKRKHEELTLEKARLEKRIEVMKLTIKGKVRKLKKGEEEMLNVRYDGQEKVDIDVDYDLLQRTSERKIGRKKKDEDKEEENTLNRRLAMKEKELKDYEEREAKMIAAYKEEESKWDRQSETQRQNISELQQKIDELLNK